MKNLKNAKILSKTEQQSINGGKAACDARHFCGPNEVCLRGVCYTIIDC